MAVYNVVSGQTNYDICLAVYGSLDLLIKLCKDNGVQDLNIVSAKQYIYDPTLVLDINVTGYPYSTKPI